MHTLVAPLTRSFPAEKAPFCSRWLRNPLWIIACFALGCGGEGGPVERTSLPRIATGTRGMVVSGSEHATRAGAQILDRGGNAVDAAVATAIALAVTEPTQSGLGGRTQAVVWSPSAPAFGIDATTVVPAGFRTPDRPQPEDGYAVIGVPGSVAAWAELIERTGSLPWNEVIAPALRLAEEGFALSEGEAGRLASVAERLAETPGARAVFLAEDGSAFEAGDTLVQPDLARVLRALAEEGPRVFYEGWIAEQMVADLRGAGSVVSLADLRSYDVRESIMVTGSFESLDLVGSYLPASGATTIEALQILDQLDLAALEPDDRALAIGRALEASFRDREDARADPDPPDVDAAWITSVELAQTRAAEILNGALDFSFVGPDESPNTTHLSVVDGSGMAVSMTQSLGPTGGSRVATQGLGFLYAATMGYLDRSEPGARPWSSQSPLIALRGGDLALVIGGAGARRIISAMVQTLVRSEVEGLPIDEALAAPRLHPTDRWHFEQIDSDVIPAGAELIRDLGVPVFVRPSSTYFARINAISVGADGEMIGIADPRWAWGAASGPG